MGQWINFAEVRARISLEDVLFGYYRIDTLKRDGNKVVGPCPVHGGDSPRAFHADLEKNVWHCFSRCQRGGNQLDFVALKEGIVVREAALRLLAHVDGEQRPTPPAPPTTATTPTPPAPTTATTTSPAKPAPGAGDRPARPEPKASRANQADEDEANPVLKITLALKGDHPHLVEERKLKSGTIAEFGVGYCGRGMLRGMIAIPVHDEDGDLVAYAGRRLKPADIRSHGKYRFPKGFKKERVLFNYHRARTHAPTEGLILVEGFFSVLKLAELGFPNVVATMGCELSDYQAKLLERAPDVTVLFDGDDAGRAGAARVRERLAPHTAVRVVNLPGGVKPDALSARAIRWIVNGMKALNLVELSFAFAGDAAPPTTDPPTT